MRQRYMCLGTLYCAIELIHDVICSCAYDRHEQFRILLVVVRFGIDPLVVGQRSIACLNGSITRFSTIIYEISRK